MLERLKGFAGRIDIFLLLFLTFFTIDKVVVKPVVLFLALLWLVKRIKKGDLKSSPLFYLALPVLAVMQLVLVNRDFASPHLISFTVGVAYWMMAFLAFVVVKVRIRYLSVEQTSNTLLTFFWINFAVSVWGLVAVMYQSGSMNPYALEDIRYGNSTGDYIKGVFMAPCYINTFVNCAFAFYFLNNNKYKLSFLAVVLACITTSNFASLMLILLLLVSFFVFRQKTARVTLLLQLVFIGCFYLFVSTNNLYYLLGSLTRKKDARETLIINKLKADLKAQGKEVYSNNGKFISFELTYLNEKSDISRMLLGSGMGNFSSQLALNTADIQQATRSRFFSKLPVYVANDFRENHYQVYSAIYALPEEYHSIRHLPRSFYNLLFGEYGLMGFLLFVVFYVWYFLKRAKGLRASIIIGVLLGYFLLFDYMFEYLSIVLFFELFFLLEVKQRAEKELATEHAA